MQLENLSRMQGCQHSLTRCVQPGKYYLRSRHLCFR